MKEENDIKVILDICEAFIFDMDGTIVDLEELNYRGYLQTVKESFDLDLSEIEYLKHFAGSRTAEGFQSYLKEQDIIEYEVEELVRNFRNIKRENLENKTKEVVSLKEGVKKYFEYLKSEDKKICLATSTVEEFVNIIIEFFNLSEYFNTIITAEDVTEGKPSPQVYKFALDKLGTNKEKSVVFEDSKNGIASAKNAGVLCVGILTKGLNDKFVTKADFVIRSYLELI